MATDRVAHTEEILKRIQHHKCTAGVIVINTEGIPVRTTLDNSSTVHYSRTMHHLIERARSAVREVDPQDDLSFLRLGTKKNEVMIAPGDDSSALVVVQNPVNGSN